MFDGSLDELGTSIEVYNELKEWTCNWRLGRLRAIVAIGRHLLPVIPPYTM